MAALRALAIKILVETENLANFIDESGQKEPSFDVNGPPTLTIPVENGKVQESRMSLMRAAEDLSTLALGPAERLRWQAWNV